MFITTSPSATSTHGQAERLGKAYGDRTGVCQDYAPLAVALCRRMNIPARYCTGYLGDS